MGQVSKYLHATSTVGWTFEAICVLRNVLLAEITGEAIVVAAGCVCLPVVDCNSFVVRLPPAGFVRYKFVSDVKTSKG